MSMVEKEVAISTPEATLPGSLAMPAQAGGLVVFVHGSGSSRLSPRNRFVAAQLNQAGNATLLFDLLTPEEARVDEVTGELRFDITLLSQRLDGVLDWIAQQAELNGLKIGLFGASTGAAAALRAAARRPERIAAVVSRGGRPDLAGDVLSRVEAPTLLIVGALDEVVLGLNRQAAKQLKRHGLEVVAGATHLFEEAGKLEEVATLAAKWFNRHLGV
jgi:putative phosphoribosyl transferase